MLIETNISITQCSAEPNKTPARISKQRINNWRVFNQEEQQLKSGQQQDGGSPGCLCPAPGSLTSEAAGPLPMATMSF